MIFEQIRNQFRLFQTARMRNLSIENIAISKNEKLEVQQKDLIHISKSTSPKRKSVRSSCSCAKHNKNNLGESINNDFKRITEENEEIIISRRNSTYKQNKSKKN